MGVLGAAMLLFTIAELEQSASGLELAQGERLGAHGRSKVLGPGIVSALIISFGPWGWAVVAELVLIAGLLIVLTADAAARRKGADLGDEHG